MIAINPYITRNEMAIECGVTSDAIKFQLKKLKEKGLIRRIGSDRSGSWEVMDHSS
ncbi:MAG: winged helix-turn-helix transcriptional regulator [Bacteroides sp.]|nr:winged helix-turn-helix transcriptional regulator [Bacteroides sp.]